MMNIRMHEFLFGLVVLLAVGALSCVESMGNKDTAEPDTIFGSDNVLDIPLETVDIVVPSIPVAIIRVLEEENPPCACPADGWCAVTREDFDIHVAVDLLNLPAGEFLGVTKVSLLHTGADGEPNVIDWSSATSRREGDEADYYQLYFQISEIDTGTEFKDGAHELTVDVETDVVYNIGSLEIPLVASTQITVVVDLTPPSLVLDFSSPVPGGIYAQELPVSYCLKDIHPLDGQQEGGGIALESIKFSLAKGEEIIELPHAGGPALACAMAVPLKLNIEQSNTDTYEFRLEMEDCLGNAGIETVPDVTVVGLPDYQRADTESLIEMGVVNRTRPVHLGTKLHGEVHFPDDYPDLVFFSEGGIAFALNDGEGHIGKPELVYPDLTVTDGYAWDVNGDYATDLVVLMTGDGGTYLRVYLQNVTIDQETLSWEPTGTFPTKATESYFLSAQNFEVMDRYDINGDGFQDLMVAGEDADESGALLLHSGEVTPWPDVGQGPDDKPEDPDEPNNDAPEQPNHFVIHDTLQSSGGITDLYIGQFLFSGPGDPGPPEVAVVRPDLKKVTVIPLDDEFHFLTGLDTSFCWGEASKIAKPADLRRGMDKYEVDTSDIWHDPANPGIEDLVIYSETTKSLHFVPNMGTPYSGYFALQGESLDAELCAKPQDDSDQFSGELGFGQESVSGTVSFLYVTPPVEQPGCGYVVYVGEEPDGVWLGDVVHPSEEISDEAQDGWTDLIVAVSGKNHVAFHPGQADGTFCLGTKVNPGHHPRACTVADFNQDGVLEVLCTVTSAGKTGQCTSKVEGGKVASGSLSFAPPRELALPLSVHWKNGTVKPTHFLVADVEQDGDNDIIVATTPETIYYSLPEGYQETWKGEWDEDMNVTSNPLILTYRLEDGEPVTSMPDQTAVELSFDKKLTAVTTGDFDGNGHPDLAISIDRSVQTVCDGRSVDLMLGNQTVAGLVNPDEIGTSSGVLSLFDVPVPGYFSPKGRFRPMGGTIFSKT